MGRMMACPARQRMVCASTAPLVRSAHLHGGSLAAFTQPNGLLLALCTDSIHVLCPDDGADDGQDDIAPASGPATGVAPDDQAAHFGTSAVLPAAAVAAAVAFALLA